MSERILTCPVCGKEFKTSHPTKKYCSRECYGQANKERCREHQRCYYKTHRQAEKKRQQEYYLAHKEEVLERQKAHYKKNVERYRERHRYYRQQAKARKCCAKHGGIDNCPYEDCICE